MSRAPYHTPTVYVVGTYRDAASMMAHSLTVHSTHTSHGSAIETYCRLFLDGHDPLVVETNGALLPGQTFGEVDVEGWDDVTPGLPKWVVFLGSLVARA